MLSNPQKSAKVHVFLFVSRNQGQSVAMLKFRSHFFFVSCLNRFEYLVLTVWTVVRFQSPLYANRGLLNFNVPRILSFILRYFAWSIQFCFLLVNQIKMFLGNFRSSMEFYLQHLCVVSLDLFFKQLNILFIEFVCFSSGYLDFNCSYSADILEQCQYCLLV